MHGCLVTDKLCTANSLRTTIVAITKGVAGTLVRGGGRIHFGGGGRTIVGSNEMRIQNNRLKMQIAMRFGSQSEKEGSLNSGFFDVKWPTDTDPASDHNLTVSKAHLGIELSF